MTVADADDLIEQALRALDTAAAAFGENTARHAAAILRGSRSGGRPEMDDTAALKEVERLRAAGKGCAAVGIVAAGIGGTPGQVRATGRRLQRKLRQNRLSRSG